MRQFQVLVAMVSQTDYWLISICSAVCIYVTIIAWCVFI